MKKQIKHRVRVDIEDAQHPYRQAAIAIIENIIEPITKKRYDGKRYYDLEDELVDEINKSIKFGSKIFIF